MATAPLENITKKEKAEEGKQEASPEHSNSYEKMYEKMRHIQYSLPERFWDSLSAEESKEYWMFAVDKRLTKETDSEKKLSIVNDAISFYNRSKEYKLKRVIKLT